MRSPRRASRSRWSTCGRSGRSTRRRILGLGAQDRQVPRGLRGQPVRRLRRGDRAIVAEEAFDYLDGPVTRIAGPDVPGVPYNHALEDWFMLDPEKIAAGDPEARRVLMAGRRGRHSPASASAPSSPSASPASRPALSRQAQRDHVLDGLVARHRGTPRRTRPRSPSIANSARVRHQGEPRPLQDRKPRRRADP